MTMIFLGHRGSGKTVSANYKRPIHQSRLLENSLNSIEAALAGHNQLPKNTFLMPCDGVEIDIAQTADGILMCTHNPRDILLNSGKKSNYSEFHEKNPFVNTLEEILQTFQHQQNKTLAIELKEDGCEEALYALLEKHQESVLLRNNITVISFSATRLSKFHEIAGDIIKTGLLIKSDLMFSQTTDRGRSIPEHPFKPSFASDISALLLQSKATIFGTRWADMRPDFLRLIQQIHSGTERPLEIMFSTTRDEVFPNNDPDYTLKRDSFIEFLTSPTPFMLISGHL
jgi:glycerophosphoryl diester phosphodiesterase